MSNALYLKTISPTGNKQYRNMAPNVSSNRKLTYNYQGGTDYEDAAGLLATRFIPIQVEQPYVEDGKMHFKYVSEVEFTIPVDELPTGSGGDDPYGATIPGVDSWEDVTDEKLTANFYGSLDGTYPIRFAKAASGIDDAATVLGSFAGAVEKYCEAITSKYKTADTNETPEWLNAHLTGTKDSVVAQSD